MNKTENYLLVIKPKKKFNLGVKELLEYRELLYFFTWRDVKVKYKQTVMGFLWVILQPALMTLLFTTFLGNAISEKTELSVPYPAFALSGLVIWNFFSSGLSNAANSMVNNANIIKKIYFPRLIIPLSAILGSTLDFAISFILFLILMIVFKISLNPLMLLFLPLCLLLLTLATIGLGMLLAAMNVKYRDVRYILPFFIQGMLFLSPVMFPITITHNELATLILKFNPIAGPLELLRALFSNYPIDFHTLLYSSITTLILFTVGLTYFRKTESQFADIA